MSLSTKQVLLVSYVAGVPKKEIFKTVETKINPDDLPEGEVLLKVLYLSVDPYMRMRLTHTEGYSTAYPLNQPINGAGVTKVVKSKNAKFHEGDLLAGFGIAWSEYTFAHPEKLGLRKVTSSTYPLSYHLNILGMTALSAYFGLLEVTDPKENETVVVSGAAGAVGYVAGQLAKIRGSKVIGITGSDEKVKILKEKLHFDEVFNYKKVSSISEGLVAALKTVHPGVANPKIDVYFDNVGGETLDAALALLNKNGRVSICGQISQYNKSGTDEERYAIKNITNLLLTTSKVQGFMVNDFVPKFGAALVELEGWLREGKLQSIEDVVVGLENIGDAFIGLFVGDNIGKRVVKVADA